MKQTRGAIGNLINRYRAVLRKCHLLNTFGSLALAGMLVLGGATVSLAENLLITDVVGSNERYSGSNQDTLTFDAPSSETSHFDGIASGFGTIQINKDTTVSVANLCTGVTGGSSTGGGIWAELEGTTPATLYVTGEGQIISEHTDVNAHKTMIISGNLKIQNISDGTTTGLSVDPDGMLIVTKGGLLDATLATQFKTSETNFKVEAGGTLIVASDFDVKGEIAGTLQVKGDVTLSDLSGGTVQAENNITLVTPLTNAHGFIDADQNIDAIGKDITKADAKDLNLKAGGAISANNITATSVTAQTLNVSSVTADTITAAHVSAQTLKAQDATVDGGSLNLSGSDSGDAGTVKKLSLANGTQAKILGTLNLTDDTSILAVGSTSDTEGGTTLAAQNINLKGGMILVDPAWTEASSNVAIENLGDQTQTSDVLTLNGKVGVGKNSYMAIGTENIDWLPGVVGELSETGTRAALGLFRPITIENGNGLVVNGALTGVTENSDLHSAVSEATNKAVFASNTLLVVNGQAINGDKAAITFGTSGTVEVANGAKLLVTGAVAGQEYIIVANASEGGSTLKGWKKYTTTYMLSLSDATWEDGSKVVVTVTRNEASKVFPGLSEELVGTVNALYAGTPNVHSTDQGVRFLSRATDNEFLGLDKRAAVRQMESATRIAFAAAVPQMTKMASNAATNAVVNRLGLANPENGAKAMNVDGKLVDDKALGLALWIAPLWSNQTGFGMEAGNLDYGYSANIGGISLGADYTWANNIRAGLMFNVGGGYAQSSGDLAETTNSMTFWGVGAYGGWEYNNFAVMADVSYTSTWNSVNQDVDSRMKMSDLEADIQASAISAGLRFEYKLETQYLDLIPHVGARYMSINTWGYDVDNNEGTVLEGDGFQQNIWTFPVGITLSKELEMNNDWYFKPAVDFTVIPAAGDIKAKQDVRFGNLPATEMKTQMMDYLTWQGGVGLEFGNDNMSVGVNYTLQAGQNSTGHGVFGMFRYEF